LLNYLALLGWSISADRDIFTLEEMCKTFDVASVNPNPARFDQKKADSINASHIRLLSDSEFLDRTLPYLVSAGVLPAKPNDAQLETLSKALPLVKERITVLSEASGMLGFLFTDELTFEPEALAQLPAQAGEIAAKAIEALAAVADFSTENIQQALSEALIEKAGLKPRDAFAVVRVAVSGRRVTPPLFECLEILGKDRSVARLEAFSKAH
jgi:glutamyl-tRNA synthetase